MVSKYFQYKVGELLVRFTVFIDNNGEVTIIEPDGCSFCVSSMPLSVWREVNAFIEANVPEEPQ